MESAESLPISALNFLFSKFQGGTFHSYYR